MELYNDGTSQIDLSGYFLTDNRNKPTKWKIPANTKIDSKGYLVFYCDGLDSALHTNFKLKEDGEFIGLYNPNSTPVDTLHYGRQRLNISWGRNTGNLSSFAYFQTPTFSASNGTSTITEISSVPTLSINGGFYSSSQIISITGPAGAEIYYTTNGSSPSNLSKKYSAEITIPATTCLRVISYEPRKLPSNIITNTYFINEQRNLPVISLVTDSINFFSNETGIYVTGTHGLVKDCSNSPMNVNQDWEREVNVEYFDITGGAQINNGAGVKIFGGCSRQRYPIKSLALFARSEFGKNSFDYKFFKSRKFTSYDALIIRSGSDDQPLTTFRDPVSQLICDDLEMETSAYQPVVLYINGKYWGIHDLQEKQNEAYFEQHYGVNKDEVNIIDRNPQDSTFWHTGTAESYNDLITYVNGHNLATTSYYDYVNTQMDIESFIDYESALIYMGMDDWPGNNIRYWRADSGRFNKWRWACYDLDHTFKNINQNWRGSNKSTNTLELATEVNCNCYWPNPSWSTLLLRKLLTNASFKNEFIQNEAFQINTVFEPTRAIGIIDSIATIVSPEIPNHIKRWGGAAVPNKESWISPIFDSVAKWERNVEAMRNFARVRPDTMFSAYKKYFKLTGTVNLTISKSTNEAGYVKFNRKRIKTNTLSGKFFKNIPITFTAIPAAGYSFARWEVTATGSTMVTYTTKKINVNPTANTTINAVFEKLNTVDPIVVINEINYHSSTNANSGDWIELYNVSGQALDISNWVVRDGTDYNWYTLPDNLIFEPNTYLIVCQDSNAFNSSFPLVSNIYGEMEFGLSNGGELIRLYDAGNKLVDSVRYNDKAPWPIAADGNGSTLELISPDLDNSLATNWIGSYLNGTPDTLNQSNIPNGSTGASIVNHDDTNILYQNFPNPFHSSTTIIYNINEGSDVQLVVRDMFGRTSNTYAYQDQAPGIYKLTIDAGSFEKGIYIYTLVVNDKTIDSKKMIVK